MHANGTLFIRALALSQRYLLLQAAIGTAAREVKHPRVVELSLLRNSQDIPISSESEVLQL